MRVRTKSTLRKSCAFGLGCTLVMLAGLAPVTCWAEEATTNAFALKMHAIIVPEIHLFPHEEAGLQNPFACITGVVCTVQAAVSNQNSFALHARNLTMLELVDLICFLSDTTYAFNNNGLVIAPTNAPAVQLKQNAKKEKALIAKLKCMVVPECMFRYPARILDAMDVLVQDSRLFDVPAIPDDQRGVNFAVKDPCRLRYHPPSDDNPSLPIVESFPGPMCTLYDNLTNICEKVDARFMIRDNTVVIYPAAETNTPAAGGR